MQHLMHSDDIDYSQFFSIIEDEEGYFVNYNFDENQSMSNDFLANLINEVNLKIEACKKES